MTHVPLVGEFIDFRRPFHAAICGISVAFFAGQATAFLALVYILLRNND